MTDRYETKYKDCSPADTVARIKAILQERGIETEEDWTYSGLDSICSVRITVRGTDIGQNGKGTDQAFAAASGYAEFMERYATGFLMPDGVAAMHDREWFLPAELVQRGGSLLLRTCEGIQRADNRNQHGGKGSNANAYDVSVSAHLANWSFAQREDGKLAAIPFTSMSTGAVEYLPECMLRAYYVTNGSCAGNTREEALVQGISEIAERYAVRKVFEGRLTPPTIPDEAFSQWPVLRDAVSLIRNSGRFGVRIMDASLGMGLPVAAATLIDRQTAKVVTRFGAHPRFEIALERCLTEILQGKTLERLENAPIYDIRADASATGLLNYFNFTKVGMGVLPAQSMMDESSWPYHPFKEAPATTDGQLAFMEELFAALGWEIYVRDCSFAGFPVYHVIVPNVSVVLDYGSMIAREKASISFFREHMWKLAQATPETIAHVRRMALFKKDFAGERSFEFLSGLPISPKLCGVPIDAGILAAICSMVLGDLQKAADLLSPYRFDSQGNMTRLYPLVQLLYAEDSETAYAAMRALCPEGWAEEARSLLRNPSAAFPEEQAVEMPAGF